MQAVTPTDPIPAVEGRNAPYALFAAAIGAQILTVGFSLGLLYWISPIICLITIFVMTAYIYRLSWNMGIKSAKYTFKLGILVIMFINILFSLYVYYSLK